MARTKEPTREKKNNDIHARKDKKKKKKNNVSSTLNNIGKFKKKKVHKKIKNIPSFQKKEKDNTNKPKIKKKKKSGIRALMDIKKYQKSVANLIPKSSFRRLCREIIDDVDTDVMGNSNGPKRMKKIAFEALQEITEYFMVELFTETQSLAIHRKKPTITIHDLIKAKDIIFQ